MGCRQRGGHPGGRQDRRRRHVRGGNSKFALARYNSDGTLDATFGGDGKVMTDFTAHDDAASGVAIQADGKIVVVGMAGEGQVKDRSASRWVRWRPLDAKFALARYNSDGTLDATFGGDGKVMTDVTAYVDGASGVAIQADGKIVAAGVAADQANHHIYPRFALARYNSDGSLDTTFGGDGKVMTQFSAGPEDVRRRLGSAASGVAIQADGKVVVVGSSGSLRPQVRPGPLQPRRHARRDLQRRRQGRDRLHPEIRRGRWRRHSSRREDRRCRHGQ